MTILYQYPPIPAPAAPVGGATEAKQDEQIVLATDLNDIVAKEAKQDVEIAFLNQISDDAASLLLIAATGAKQDTGNASLASIDTKLTSQATAANQTTGNASLSSIDTKISSQATAANQATGNASLSSIDGKLTTLNAVDFSTEAKQDDIITELSAIQASTDSIDVKLPATLGQKTMANSLAVTLASDQSPLAVLESALTITFQEILNLTTSVQTFTAPVGTRWMLISTDDTNDFNIRVKIGGTATISSGVQFQPGRSEMIKGGGNVSVIAESGTNQKINIQFGA